MVVWGSVTVGAIGVSVMCEPDLGPVVDVMTGGALAGFMRVWCCMAVDAIILATVIEGDFVPGICPVT
jgi:hypothetical protein